MAKSNTSSITGARDSGAYPPRAEQDYTIEQMQLAMEAIGGKARAGQRICNQLLPQLPAECEDAEALLAALESIMAHIGTVADQHSLVAIHEGPEGWTLPPTWRQMEVA